MYCKNCGTELTDNAKFCANCGDKIEIETKIENKKTTKLTRKQIVTLSIIVFLIIGLLINEYKTYQTVKTFKTSVIRILEIGLDDIDNREREMMDKCTEDGILGKYGNSFESTYLKQKACYKKVAEITETMRQAQYTVLLKKKSLTYFQWRKQVKIARDKVKAKNKIIKSFNDNEYLIKSFLEDVKGLAEHNNNDWGAVSTVIAQRYNMGGYNIPKSGAKLLYVVNNEILLKSGDFYMNSAGEVEYKPELSKVRSEFKF